MRFGNAASAALSVASAATSAIPSLQPNSYFDSRPLESETRTEVSFTAPDWDGRQAQLSFPTFSPQSLSELCSSPGAPPVVYVVESSAPSPLYTPELSLPSQSSLQNSILQSLGASQDVLESAGFSAYGDDSYDSDNDSFTTALGSNESLEEPTCSVVTPFQSGISVSPLPSGVTDSAVSPATPAISTEPALPGLGPAEEVCAVDPAEAPRERMRDYSSEGSTEEGAVSVIEPSSGASRKSLALRPSEDLSVPHSPKDTDDSAAVAVVENGDGTVSNPALQSSGGSDDGFFTPPRFSNKDGSTTEEKDSSDGLSYASVLKYLAEKKNQLRSSLSGFDKHYKYSGSPQPTGPEDTPETPDTPMSKWKKFTSAVSGVGSRAVSSAHSKWSSVFSKSGVDPESSQQRVSRSGGWNLRGHYEDLSQSVDRRIGSVFDYARQTRDKFSRRSTEASEEEASEEGSDGGVLSSIKDFARSAYESGRRLGASAQSQSSEKSGWLGGLAQRYDNFRSSWESSKGASKSGRWFGRGSAASSADISLASRLRSATKSVEEKAQSALGKGRRWFRSSHDELERKSLTYERATGSVRSAIDVGKRWLFDKERPESQSKSRLSWRNWR